MNPNFFIGPMSKNIIDATIEFCNDNEFLLGLIPSRRQIEKTSGYVNNWSTKEFSEYVKSNTQNILLVRDHAGPLQGQVNDDGYESLEEDCKYFDIIHVDPWKKYSDIEQGTIETIKMIEFCNSINDKIKFEIGTEESIRKFDTRDLTYLIYNLKKKLNSNIYKKIEYLVIQSGTSLKGNEQTGKYDRTRLTQMIDLCKTNGFISKEHNGDYIQRDVINEKFKMGLQSINIAPEFGMIETMTYLNQISDSDMLKIFFEICYDSKKWCKWVNSDFDPFKNKLELIKICGHYVLSNEKFLNEIKSNLKNIDDKVKKNVKRKLNELSSIKK